MKKYFETLGYKVLDIIPDDPENGIHEGFVALEKEDMIFELSYWNATGHYLRYDENIEKSLKPVLL